MICTFLGHKDVREDILPVLEKTISGLIQKYPDIRFYVGHNGGFDRLAQVALKKLSANYAVVLAYPPGRRNDVLYGDSPTIYPEGLETVPKRFAISHWNRWMVKNSDMVITYIWHTASQAAEFVRYAENQGKTVINIADLEKN